MTAGGIEGRLAREQFAQRRAQAVDVGPLVQIVAVVSLFRRHVIQRAHQLPDRRQFINGFAGCAEQRESQVENPNLAASSQHQV